MSRVVVTGMGVVSPVGQTVTELFDNLIAARSGIRRISANVYSGPNPLVAGQIDFDATAYWSAHQAAHFDRGTQFAIVAVQQAVVDAHLELADDEALAAGVYWGTGLGGASSIEESYRQLYGGNGRVRPASVVLGMSNAAAGQISIANGLRGPVLNVSTACSSSASAIGEAYRAIKHGYVDVIVAGGSEALVTNGNLPRVGCNASAGSRRSGRPVAELQTILGKSHRHRTRRRRSGVSARTRRSRGRARRAHLR